RKHGITAPIDVRWLVQVCNLHRNVSAYSDVLKRSSRGYKPRAVVVNCGNYANCGSDKYTH
ncbi:MAG: hypothetical protein RL368_1810, partial [Pseudomonadota bacterium]